MRKQIYFHIDEVARDSIVAANLKMILAAQGVDIVYGNRMLSNYLPRACPFDAMILPHLSFIETLDLDPKVPLPPIIVLPTEGIGGIPEDPQRSALKFLGRRFLAGHREWADKAAAYCLWGQQQVIGFERYAPELLPRCHIIGHPRFDRRCLVNPAAKNRADDGRIRIGLQTRFSTINPHDSRSTLVLVRDCRKSVYHHLQQKDSDLDIEDIIFTNVSDLRLIFDFMDLVDPKLHDVRLRVHPREDRTKWEQIIAANKLPMTLAQWDQPYIHWIEEVDWLVSPPSTSFYDSFYMGKPGVCTHNIVPRRKNHVLRISDDTSKILQYTIQPNSMDELLATVLSKPKGKIEMPQGVVDILRHDVNYPQCQNSLDALAGVCKQVLAEHPVKISLKDRLFFDALAKRASWRRQEGVDQGAWFRLGRERTAWIDGLAASKPAVA